MYGLPAFADSRWAQATIKCMQVTQNRLKTTIPIDPSHNPAMDTALGNAKIPAPILPFTM